jgi:Arc/MetJ-type ribon-helix-helix transcriptional regulator
MKMVTLKMPEAYIEAIDQLVKKGIFSNRSEAIRFAVRKFLDQYKVYLAEELDQPEDYSDEYRPASEYYEEGEEIEIGF